mgnify:FL=1
MLRAADAGIRACCPGESEMTCNAAVPEVLRPVVHEDFSDICYGDCPRGLSPVFQAVSGAWYIAGGHPGFNLPRNNGGGYESRNGAMAAMRRCLGKRAKVQAWGAW